MYGDGMPVVAALRSSPSPWAHRYVPDPEVVTFVISPATYAGVPPGGAEPEGVVSCGRLLEVALVVTSVQAGRDHRVAKPENMAHVNVTIEVCNDGQ